MHICEVPVNAPARRRWWTCDCGQVWTRVNGLWTLTPRQDPADTGDAR